MKISALLSVKLGNDMVREATFPWGDAGSFQKVTVTRNLNNYTEPARGMWAAVCNILGKRNSQCKGPEAEMHLA